MFCKEPYIVIVQMCNLLMANIFIAQKWNKEAGLQHLLQFISPYTEQLCTLHFSPCIQLSSPLPITMVVSAFPL